MLDCHIMYILGFYYTCGCSKSRLHVKVTIQQIGMANTWHCSCGQWSGQHWGYGSGGRVGRPMITGLAVQSGSFRPHIAVSLWQDTQNPKLLLMGRPVPCMAALSPFVCERAGKAGVVESKGICFAYCCFICLAFTVQNDVCAKFDTRILFIHLLKGKVSLYLT